MPVDAMDIPLVRQYWETGKAEGVAEGIAEGKLQGVATGKREGMAELLIHQLECRFGRLPEPARDRIRQASPEQILHWSTAVFTAESLSQLLD